MHTATAFVDKIISQKGQQVHKIVARDKTGNWACYYMFVEPRNEKIIDEAVKSKGPLDLSKYGKILASCYGTQASPKIKAELKQKYGFDITDG